MAELVFFSSRRRHTRFDCDWSSDVCSSDLEMFGLSPMPERTDLKPVITGRAESDHVIVEKIHFQSSPGLYVTANLYLPKKISGPLPTILYLCGHAIVKTNNISYGNKAGYQHHGAWFARQD